LIVETYNLTTKKWVKKEIDADDINHISQNKITQYELSKAIEVMVDIHVAKNFGKNAKISFEKN
tara:strand:+ start:342 stop:533 length:192 start_codon:yes stop_codon:yes gene_type:complete